MNDKELINEIFFLNELGYTRDEIADKLNGLLYDMAIDYYTSLEAEDHIVAKEELLNEIEYKLMNLLITLQAAERIQTQVEILMDNTREML